MKSKVTIAGISLCVIFLWWYGVEGGKEKFDRIILFRSFLSRANVSLREGKPEQAIYYWKEALRINPKPLGLYNKIGIIYMNEGKIGEAEEIFKKALRIKPTYPEASFNLALISMRRELYQDALKYLDMTLAANRIYPRVHYLKFQIYEHLGDTKRARKEVIAELNVHPGSVDAWQEVLKR